MIMKNILSRDQIGINKYIYIFIILYVLSCVSENDILPLTYKYMFLLSRDQNDVNIYIYI